MFTGKLKPFQEEALDRILSESSLLVAYDMGLGKTVISIAAIEHLLEDGEVGTGLVVVPASLKYQWLHQIEKFTDNASVMVIDGDVRERERQYRRIKAGGIEYVLLNYEQVVNDWQFIKYLPRDYVVLDEATYIKGFKAERTKKVKQLSAPVRIALTGQPIENRAEEVYSIMEWVDPDVLGSFDVFDRVFIKRDGYGRVKYYKNLPTLHERLQTAMVRKTREEVKDQLPQVSEELVLIDFDPAGAKLYRYIAKDLVQLLKQAHGFGKFDVWAHYNGHDTSEANALRGQIMSRLTCLRMLCDHPELLRISAKRFDGSQLPGSGVTGGSMYASKLAAEGLLDGLGRTPKFDETLKLIDEILDMAPQNKVVLFSFFKPTLALLHRALRDKGIGSVRFTGDMTSKQKDAAKEQFRLKDDVRVFLSSDSGGYGLDLPEANYLVSYNLPWSSGKLEQRNARIVRLSSEFEAVTVMSMQMSGSIEERQFQALDEKHGVASAIVDGKGIDRKGRFVLTLDTLADFLQTSRV